MVLNGHTAVYCNKGYLPVMHCGYSYVIARRAKRSARRGTEGNTFRCNLLVPSIEMHSSIDALYREIAPQGHFLASLRAPRPFGPRNDSTIESFRVNRLLHPQDVESALNGSSPWGQTKNQIPGWVSGFLVARQGLEPWTHALKGRCSTN